MESNQFQAKGLTDEQVIASREKHGINKLTQKNRSGFFIALANVLKEPMFMLLFAATTVYFITGKSGDGFFMVAAIILIATISLYQDSRSRNALDALKNLTQPRSKVIRNGAVIEISIEELVPGDAMVIEEGFSVPADGVIMQANDFSVNESMLTGESLPVAKNEASEDNKVFQGTTVVSGLAICRVEATGNNTRLGKIGTSLAEIEEEATPLQQQISQFVKLMAVVGSVVFVIVWGINFAHSRNITDSLLKALTLAMSILPEEIPVAFTTFMALGAWRLMKMGIIVKQTRTVETLGSATVICTDKTGTITENKMSLAKMFVLASGKITLASNEPGDDEKELIQLAMWSSEPVPFDPMEVALHEAYLQHADIDKRGEYLIVHEYPLSGKPPMMTHIFENKSGHRIIAAKGAPEALIKVSDLSEAEREKITEAVESLSREGYRVLGVGVTEFTGNDFPGEQQEFRFVFKGVVAFYDPPKDNIGPVLQSFYDAGISVKIITGDNAATTATIAKQIGFKGAEHTISGEVLVSEKETKLEEDVMQINIFTRMFPEAKLRIINALKAKGQIVAMTGDGVNDGPALKAAHIGIAMGKKGSEIARQASSLILMDDDLGKMVLAIAQGRKIYTNLKKAIRYIISIHIPIILVILIPLALGWIYPNIFSPVHIIFFELIMAPTCSVIFENEPIEKNAMQQPPRPFTTTFFKWSELGVSVLQGLVILGGLLVTYQYAVQTGSNEAVTRTMVFVSLITANIFLTLVNRSFHYSIITTAGYPNKLVWGIIASTILLSGLILYINPLCAFFEFEHINRRLLTISILIGIASVTWFELVKFAQRIKNK